MKPIKQFKIIYTLFDLLTIPIKKPKKAPKIIECNKILIFESHLIGDITLSLQLCIFLKKEFPSKRIIFLARPFAKPIMRALGVTQIEFIEFIPPWINQGLLDFKKLKSLIKLIKYIRKLNIDIFLENRGDVRNILFGHFLKATNCIGYNFTAGKNFLTYIIPDDGCRKHLNFYNFQIGKIFKKNLNYADYIKLSAPKKKENKSIENLGIHLGASQKNRQLSKNQKNAILGHFTREYSNKTIIIFDDGIWLSEIDEDCYEQLSNVKILKDNFEDFLDNLKKIDALICLDSGPSHLCSLFGVNSIVVTGPTFSKFTHPVHNSISISPEPSIKIGDNSKLLSRAEIEKSYFSAIDRLLKLKLDG